MSVLPDKPHLLPREVKVFLRLSRATVYRYLKVGIIPSIRIGKLYRIPRAEFLQYVETHRNGQ